MEEKLILVNELDQQIGTSTKEEAHKKGYLHRAFSIFLFNKKGELLLQQRALHKYHSPGLWSNTCCSHPRENESTYSAANRRLMEEMGITCALEKQFDFIYRTNFDNGLIEHEFDHVYFGYCNELPNINKDEVAAWDYYSVSKLEQKMTENPEQFTYWFKACYGKVKQLMPN